MYYYNEHIPLEFGIEAFSKAGFCTVWVFTLGINNQISEGWRYSAFVVPRGFQPSDTGSLMPKIKMSHSNLSLKNTALWQSIHCFKHSCICYFPEPTEQGLASCWFPRRDPRGLWSIWQGWQWMHLSHWTKACPYDHGGQTLSRWGGHHDSRGRYWRERFYTLWTVCADDGGKVMQLQHWIESNSLCAGRNWVLLNIVAFRIRKRGGSSAQPSGRKRWKLLEKTFVMQRVNNG